MSNYTDMRQETVQLFVNPSHFQLTFATLLKEEKYSSLILGKESVKLITHEQIILEGTLKHNNDVIHFYLDKPSKSHFKNKHCLVIFVIKEQKYVLQCLVGSVHKDKQGSINEIVLARQDIRYYKRRNIISPSVLNPIPEKIVQDLISGNKLIRRFEFIKDNKKEEKFMTIWNDTINFEGSSFELPINQKTTLIGSEIVNISRGGVGIKIANSNANYTPKGSVLFLQSSLKWGKANGFLKCLISVRNIRSDKKFTYLNCSFLEALPLLPKSLDFSPAKLKIKTPKAEKMQIYIDHIYHGEARDLSVNVCYGVHDIEVYDNEDQKTSRRIHIQTNEEYILNLKDVDMADVENEDSIYLGISVKKADINKEDIEQENVGVEILSVNKSSPAEKSGLKAGDIITTINRVNISSKNELLAAANEIEAGKKIPVEIMRSGNIMRIFIVFEKK